MSIAGNGALRTVQGGLKACNDKFVNSSAWNLKQMDGSETIYEDIKEYLKATQKFRNTGDKFI